VVAAVVLSFVLLIALSTPIVFAGSPACSASILGTFAAEDALGAGRGLAEGVAGGADVRVRGRPDGAVRHV
jgi:hypothetical protein